MVGDRTDCSHDRKEIMTPWSLSPEIVVVPAVCMEKACWENGLILSQSRTKLQKKKRKEVRRIIDTVTKDLNYTEMNSVLSWMSNSMSTDVKRVFNFTRIPTNLICPHYHTKV